ncbi:MAG: hypothetical protein GY920_12775 [Aliivibrio sp.]|nr:hypothetical protein [Aliivibrio sp.]
MFLTFGSNETNELVSIHAVKSGKTALACPFCKQPLIAKKGAQKEHHFAHAGNTCATSKDAIQSAQLPTFDTFELLTKAEQTYLERRGKYKHKDIFYFSSLNATVEMLDRLGILEVEYHEDNAYTERVERVNASLKALNRSFIVNGKPSQALTDIFNAIMPMTGHDLTKEWQELRSAKATSISRKYHQNKLDKQRSLSQFINAQNFWFDCHYKRTAYTSPHALPLLSAKFEQLNEQHLYLFEFNAVQDDQTIQFYKIGMTTREPAQRLAEVQQMLKPHIKI